MRQKITLSSRLDRRGALYSFAEFGIGKALAEIRQPDSSPDYDALSEGWANQEQIFKDISVGDGTISVMYEDRDSEVEKKIRYGMRDEESKINLNTADPKILSRLFQIAAGLDDEEADTIAYGIVDWRDKDDVLANSSFGAEDDDYEDLDLPYDAKDGPFEVLNELLLVRGMSPEIYAKAKDYLTIYGGGAVNFNTAPKMVLMALGLDEKTADLALSYRAGTDRETGTADDRVFVDVNSITAELSRTYSLSSADLAVISNMVASGILSTKSANFRILSRGQLGNMILDVEAIVKREGNILFWSVGIPKRMNVISGKAEEQEPSMPQVFTSKNN